MKKLIAGRLCICLALSVMGCIAEPENQSSTPAQISTKPSSSAPIKPTQPPLTDMPMNAIAMPTMSKAVQAEDGTVIFSTSYQTIQLILSDSDKENLITADMNQRIHAALSTAAEMESAARDHYAMAPEHWSPYFLDVSYSTVRFDQAVVSLFEDHKSYYGGTHPSVVTDSITYDLSTGNALSLPDILAESCTGQDLSNLILAQLALRADELDNDYASVVQDLLSSDLSDIKNWYFSQNGLCFHFAPYEIAPYASGTIIAEIPYNKLGDLLKDTYFPSLPTAGTGTMVATRPVDTDTSRFTKITQLTLEDFGETFLLHAEGTVQNVRLELGTWDMDMTYFIPTCTIFVAICMNTDEAIQITTQFPDVLSHLRLSYQSNGETITLFLHQSGKDGSIILTEN